MRLRRSERAGQYESPTYRAVQSRLAGAVRNLREERGWTQEEAAYRCDMATRLLQRIESATVNVTLTTLARLCEGFETDVATLLAPAVQLRPRSRGRPRKSRSR